MSERSFIVFSLHEVASMRVADQELQADRRGRILAAAVRCFGRRGIHQASMHEIAGEAGMSAANLYRYFDSKDAIIEAIAEHEREEASALLADLEGAEDFLPALFSLLDRTLRHDGSDRIALGVEIVAEALRNPRVAELYTRLDVEATRALERVLDKAISRGQVDASLDPGATARILMAIADAVLWRRGCDPDFDAAGIAPTLETLLERFLAPRKAATSRRGRT
jgi:AcrR family transcriptional regulator